MEFSKKIKAICPACKHEGSRNEPHGMIILDEKFDDGITLHSDKALTCGSCGLQFHSWTINKKTHQIKENMLFDDGSSIIMHMVHVFEGPGPNVRM